MLFYEFLAEESAENLQVLKKQHLKDATLKDEAWKYDRKLKLTPLKDVQIIKQNESNRISVI